MQYIYLRYVVLDSWFIYFKTIHYLYRELEKKKKRIYERWQIVCDMESSSITHLLLIRPWYASQLYSLYLSGASSPGCGIIIKSYIIAHLSMVLLAVQPVLLPGKQSSTWNHHQSYIFAHSFMGILFFCPLMAFDIIFSLD